MSHGIIIIFVRASRYIYLSFVITRMSEITVVNNDNSLRVRRRQIFRIGIEIYWVQNFTDKDHF